MLLVFLFAFGNDFIAIGPFHLLLANFSLLLVFENLELILFKTTSHQSNYLIISYQNHIYTILSLTYIISFRFFSNSISQFDFQISIPSIKRRASWRNTHLEWFGQQPQNRNVKQIILLYFSFDGTRSPSWSLSNPDGRLTFNSISNWRKT